MSEIWQPLFANLALVTILVVAWDFISDWTSRLPRRTEDVLLGLVMGIGAVVSMAMTVPAYGGLYFDLRGPLIAASAFFGGLPAALVSAAMAIAYRVYIGGSGTGAGLLSIVAVGLIGYGCCRATRGRVRTRRDIVLFGVLSAVGALAGLTMLPWPTFIEVISRTGVPLFTLLVLGALVVGLLLDRQLRRRELVRSNMIYTAMVRELPDCLNVKDVEGRFIAANPATAVLMRASSAQQLIGRTDFDFFPPQRAARFRRDETDMLATGEPRRYYQPTVFPNGSEGWLATLKAPLRDQSGEIIGIITHNRDVTEIRRATEIKNEFISTVSHELRTPLTSIHGSLGLLAGGVAGELPPKAANLVKIAHANSERLVHLVNDILDVEKIESGKMVLDLQVLPLRPMVEQAIAWAANYLPDKKVRMAIIDDARRARVEVDPSRLHQVLANLLSNAIKFSPPEGTVIVRLTRSNGRVRIGVEDKGPGIPEEFRTRIFGKFEQADASSTRQVGGTGLGLSISKAIVNRLGGEIGFDAHSGMGARFYIEFAEAPSAEFGATSTPPGSEDGRERLLICTSDAEVSTILAVLLDVEHVASDTALDIESGKALLLARNYAGVVLDVDIVGDSGVQLLRDMRSAAERADLPLIVISVAVGQDRRTLFGSAIGILDWLEKPVDSLPLHAMLKRTFARLGVSSPSILHIEDDPGAFETLSLGLGPDVSVTPARTFAEAEEALGRQKYDLVILDVSLPGGSGFDLLPLVPPTTPLVILAAEVDYRPETGVKAMAINATASKVDVAALVKSFIARDISPSGTLTPNDVALGPHL